MDSKDVNIIIETFEEILGKFPDYLYNEVQKRLKKKFKIFDKDNLEIGKIYKVRNWIFEYQGVDENRVSGQNVILYKNLIDIPSRKLRSSGISFGIGSLEDSYNVFKEPSESEIEDYLKIIKNER